MPSTLKTATDSVFSWATRLWWPLTIVALDLLFVTRATAGKFPLPGSVVAVGIITFFGVLTYAHGYSKSPSIDKGEVRVALAASLVIVYMYVMSMVFFSEELTLDDASANVGQLVESFTTIVIVVVGFYFGGRTFEE